MRASPGAGLPQLHCPGCRVRAHIALQATDFEAISWRTSLNEVCQEFVAPGPVMSIQFAIGGYKNKLGYSCITFALLQVSRQVAACKELHLAGHIPIEGYPSPNRPID